MTVDVDEAFSTEYNYAFQCVHRDRVNWNVKMFKEQKIYDAHSHDLKDHGSFVAGEHCVTLLIPETHCNRQTLSFLLQIVKVDTQTGSVLQWKESETAYPQGPHMVPRPGGQAEDDGVLLVPVTNTDINIPDTLMVLDAATLKEVAKINISCHFPNLMHGLFFPSH